MYRRIDLLILSLAILYSVNVWAWNDERTHQDLSERAADHSVLSQAKGNYLKNVGFSLGLEEPLIMNGEFKSVKNWIRFGSLEEDAGNVVTAKYYNHFHNPLRPWNEAGLNTIYPGINGISLLIWAQDVSNPWSWQKARGYFYTALTGKDYSDNVVAPNKIQRDAFFANTFKGVGHIIHLIEDAAQPAHVRDDPHPLDDMGIVPQFENWAKYNAENLGLYNLPPVFPTFSQNTSITQFWDTDQYTLATGPNSTLASNIGLAEYTHANFLSEDTIFTEGFPSMSSVEKWIDPSNNRQYLKKTTEGVPVNHLAATSFLYFYRWKYFPQYTTSLPVGLDSNVYEEYASYLLPRAVGYSAGLLNYFFRGILEITAPDTYLYSIIDGSIVPQQFTYIKAKIKNTTPNEEMQNGIIQAVARYKKRIDYQPDLSTDPPVATSREAEYSYSVSAPISITSLNSDTPTEFTFDFTASPIPAGITDLYLQIIFKGTLGNETDTAIAVGMKDMNEPMHITIWNATDRFYLDGVLRTADEIRNNPQLLSRVDHNGDSISDEFIDPYDLTTRLAFTTTTDIPAVYNVIYAPLPPGRYGRIIILTDAPSFYIHVHRESTNPVDSLDSYVLYSGVINQETNEIFNNTQIYTFRGITQHQWSAYSRYYPYSTGMSTAPWPAPQNPNPYPATAINP